MHTNIITLLQSSEKLSMAWGKHLQQHSVNSMLGSHRRWDKMKQVVAGWWQGSRIQAHLLLSCSPCAPYHASTPDDTEWLSTDCLPANMWHTVQNLITNLAHLCNNCIHEVTDWRISCFKRGGVFFLKTSKLQSRLLKILQVEIQKPLK